MIVVKKFTLWIYLFSVTNRLVIHTYVDKILIKKYIVKWLRLLPLTPLLRCLEAFKCCTWHRSHFFFRTQQIFLLTRNPLSKQYTVQVPPIRKNKKIKTRFLGVRISSCQRHFFLYHQLSSKSQRYVVESSPGACMQQQQMGKSFII